MLSVSGRAYSVIRCWTCVYVVRLCVGLLVTGGRPGTVAPTKFDEGFFLGVILDEALSECETGNWFL